MSWQAVKSKASYLKKYVACRHKGILDENDMQSTSMCHGFLFFARSKILMHNT